MFFFAFLFLSPFLFNFILPRNPFSLSPYLGVGGLIIFALLVVFCLRKRRKDGFGPGGEGIITPYRDSFQSTPVLLIGGPGSCGTAVGCQHQPLMQQMSNIGVNAASAVGYPNEKRGKRQQYAQHTPNQSISSGSFYPSSFNSNQHLDPNSVSPELRSPGRHQQQQCLFSSSSTDFPSQPATSSTADTAVVRVVHEDGGRVVLRKGEEALSVAEGEGEVLPTYDSLPVGI